MSKKQTYIAPELTIYGNVEEVTLNRLGRKKRIVLRHIKRRLRRKKMPS